MLSVIKLNVIMPSVIVLNLIVLSVVRLSVSMLSVFRLNVKLFKVRFPIFTENHRTQAFSSCPRPSSPTLIYLLDSPGANVIKLFNP